ncbi:MAG: YihY/virulence factor BrkB family protein [Candidatus Eremiobacteraeota bacterium]|nr:YihY/virulence factor BrkB family protein [Candidatus Eremiobacteraeota bacterium]
MKRLILAFREGALRFSRDGCAFLAQAIAFNALFTTFPLLILLLTVASLIFPDAQQKIIDFFDTFAPALHDTIAKNIQSYIYGRSISSVIAFGFLIWSGKNLFMGLAFALNRALGIPKSRPLGHDIALAIVMLPIMGVLLLIAIALPVLLSIVIAYAHLPDPQNFTQLAAYGISMLLVFLVVIVLYTFLPNRTVSWHFAVPGATFAAIAWPILQFAFTQYTIRVDFTRVYGVLSAPLVLLLWFYIIGSVFLFGAQLCAGWAHLKGTEPVAALEDS